MYYLKEFLLNSRHPGPQREEGGSRAAGHMPLWLDPGDPRDPGDNSRRLDSMRRRVRIDTFDRNWASNFSTNLRKSVWAPQGAPRDPQGIPKGSPREPQGTPKGPHGVPKGPKCSKKKAQWAPKSPKAPKLYINKLLINRLRGHYVIII